MSAVEAAPAPTHRGTSNGNERGNTTDRRRRREWLVETYRADVDVLDQEIAHQIVTLEVPVSLGLGTLYGDGEGDLLGAGWRMACRCYRCGRLLTVDTLTVDRIKAGCEGGKYRTPLRDNREGVTNIRPACGLHNSETGGRLGAARKAASA